MFQAIYCVYCGHIQSAILLSSHLLYSSSSSSDVSMHPSQSDWIPSSDRVPDDIDSPEDSVHTPSGVRGEGGGLGSGLPSREKIAVRLLTSSVSDSSGSEPMNPSERFGKSSLHGPESDIGPPHIGGLVARKDNEIGDELHGPSFGFNPKGITVDKSLYETSPEPPTGFVDDHHFVAIVAVPPDGPTRLTGRL